MMTVKLTKAPISSKDSQEGFTLIEILFSMALIGIAVLGFTMHMVGIIKGNYTSNNFTAATNLAQDKMEQIRAQTAWDNANYCPDSGEQNLSATGALGGRYRRCWVVRDSPLGNALRQVDVTVSWHDSASHAVTLSTLVFVQ